MAQSSHKPVFKMPPQAQTLLNHPCRGAPCGYPTHRHASIGKNINNIKSFPPHCNSGQPQKIAPTIYVKLNINPPIHRRGAPCGYLTHRHTSIGKNINNKSATLKSIPPHCHSGQPQGIAPTDYVKFPPIHRRGAPCGYPTHRHASFGKNINNKSATLKSIPPHCHSGQPQGIAPTGYVKLNIKLPTFRAYPTHCHASIAKNTPTITVPK